MAGARPYPGGRDTGRFPAASRHRKEGPVFVPGYPDPDATKIYGSLFLKRLYATGEKPIYRTTFGVKGTPFSFILSPQRCGPLGVGSARQVTQ